MSADPEREAQIRRICRTLNKANPLRIAAERLLTDTNASTRSNLFVTYPFELYPQAYDKELSLAYWIIEHTPPSAAKRESDLDALHRFVSSRISSLGHAAVWTRSIAAVGTIVATLTVLVPTVYVLFLPTVRPTKLSLASLVILIVASGTVSFAQLSEYIMKKRCGRILPALKLLGNIGKAESTGFVAKALRYNASREGALTSLQSIVGRLGPEDYGGVSRRSMSLLCEALAHSDETAAELLLQVLAVVGDGSCIQPVLIAKNQFDGTDASVAAERLLPILYSRLIQQTNSTTLLRSHVGGSTEGELLRPAAGSFQGDSEELLRASERQ